MRRIRAKHVSVNAVDFTTAYYTDAASVVKTEVPPTRICGIRLKDIFAESAERSVELRSLPGWPIEGFVIDGLKVHRTSKCDVVENVPVSQLPAAGSARPAGWPDLIGGQPKEGRAAAERFAPYFDAAHFAARIEVPVRVVAGLADKTCDWRAVHAGYHAIPSKDKSLWSVPGMPHKVDGWVYREIGAWLDAELENAPESLSIIWP